MTASQAEQIAGVRPILMRVLANAGRLLGGRTINALLGLATMAIAARALGAPTLGVLVLIQAFVAFLADVVEFQSWQTVLHYGSRPLAEGRKADFQRVVRFSLTLDIVSALVAVSVGVLGSFLFAGRLGWSEAEAPIAALFMLTAVFTVSATPTGLLRLFDRFDVMARQAVLIALIRLVASAMAWVLGGGLPGFLLAYFVATLGSWCYLAGSAYAELKRRGLTEGFSWRGPLAAGMPGIWRFAWNTNLAAGLDVLFTHVATLMVGAIAGPTQAAFWRVGRQVADAMAKPAKLLTPALYPELARLRADERMHAMWRLARNVGLLTGGVGALLLLVTTVAGPPLLSAVLGKEFAPAADAMTWQVAAAVIGICALPLEPLLISLGKPGRAVWVRLAVGIAFVAALPFLISRFGLIGAGAGLAAAAGALALGMLWFILRENGNRRAADARAPDPPESPKGDL
ncbi:MAG: lipopolysaccharide biosynthesis protein [Phenylobacterium sp.]|uniref:lipopolysaccharide biosynthesis protein n=1 Tax=Phenylobacterium sp. TaxID=1871053 RepID=UPI001A54BC69|nr:lipopolysaccharide biosynthesis protein [Phenylobacterium sp.]MBL8771793.1 lipopolysaccharide biosynthesis protein [Phenylobacterium sp.]